MSCLLQLEHITKSYRDGTEKNVVLNDISLNVERGEFIAVVGPSGVGQKHSSHDRGNASVARCRKDTDSGE